MVFDCSFGLGYLPVLWSLFTIAALAVSYIMAVMENHVYPFLPSISATGSNIPESNIFSLLMNVSLILAASNYFTRYFQCQHQARHCGDNRELIYRYNQFSLVVAVTSLGGALLVANIQARREFYLMEVHDAGAVIFFACTSIYFWLQTSISYKTALYGIYSSWLCHVRFALSLLLSLCSAVYFVTAAISSYNFRKHHQSYSSLASLEPGDQGYTLHVVSNASEWLAFFNIMALSLTYFEEFQQVIMLIDCQEKSPTIISYYDGIGGDDDYEEMKLNMYDVDDGRGRSSAAGGDENNNNH